MIFIFNTVIEDKNVFIIIAANSLAQAIRTQIARYDYRTLKELDENPIPCFVIREPPKVPIVIEAEFES